MLVTFTMSSSNICGELYKNKYAKRSLSSNNTDHLSHIYDDQAKNEHIEIFDSNLEDRSKHNITF